MWASDRVFPLALELLLELMFLELEGARREGCDCVAGGVIAEDMAAFKSGGRRCRKGERSVDEARRLDGISVGGGRAQGRRGNAGNNEWGG